MGCAMRFTGLATEGARDNCRSLPCDFLEQFVPSFQRFLVLCQGTAFFGIPAFEALVFARAAVAELIREKLLTVGTDDKVDE